MPEAVTAAIAWVGAEIGGTIGAHLIMYAPQLATATIAVSTLGFSANQRRRAQAKARAAFNASLEDRTLTVRGTLEERDLVMGRVRKGGYFYPVGTKGDDSETLVFIVVMAGHSISAVNTVYFNGDALTIDGSGYVTSAPYVTTRRRSATEPITLSGGAGSVTLSHTPDAGSAEVVADRGEGGSVSAPGTIAGSVVSITGLDGFTGLGWVHYTWTETTYYARVRWMMGSDSQAAFADLVADFPTLWTSAHRLRGCAYAVVELDYSTDVFPQGVPNFSADINGADTVYDPRTATTGYSENPALLMRWYALHPMGGRRTTDQIDEDSFIAAANVADDSVDYGDGATELYTAGYVARAGQAPAEALDELAEAMAGRWGYTQGKIRVRAGALGATVATITSDWLLTRQISVRPRRPRTELRNVLQGTFSDSDNQFQPLQFPRVVDAPAVTEDGGELPADVEFPAIFRVGQAQQVAAVMLRDERQALTVTLTLKMRAYGLQLFDVVAITLDDLGWSGKLFEVVDRQFALGGGLQVTFKETAAATFDFGTSFPTNDAAPNTLLPSPTSVPTVGTLTVTSGDADQQDGSALVRTRVTWPAVADRGVTEGGFIEVGYLDGTRDTDYQVVRADTLTAHEFIGLRAGFHYLFKARAVNGSGVRGDWSVSEVHQVGGAAIPAGTGGLSAEIIALEDGSDGYSWSRPGVGFNTVYRRVAGVIEWANNTGRDVLVECSADFVGSRVTGAGSVYLVAWASTTALTNSALTDDGGMITSTTPNAASGDARVVRTFARTLADGDTLYLHALVFITTAAGTTTEMAASDINLKLVAVKR